MEGIFFEVRPKSDCDKEGVSRQVPNGTSGGNLLPVTHIGPESQEEVVYRLYLVGSLPVHPLTTMAMLPWIVAEIRRPRDHEKDGGRGSARTSILRHQAVCLRITTSSVRCSLDMGPGRPWDPLHHTLLFEHLPHHIHKLIHNSQEPSYFGCLIRDQSVSTCYVFRCEDHLKLCDTRYGDTVLASHVAMKDMLPACTRNA